MSLLCSLLEFSLFWGLLFCLVKGWIVGEVVEFALFGHCRLHRSLLTVRDSILKAFIRPRTY